MSTPLDDTMETMRARLSALSLDLEQAAITIAAKAGAARALRDHALDIISELAIAPATLAASPPDPDRFWPFASTHGREGHEARNTFDRLLYEHTPATCVPMHGTFEPIATYGHRYLVARDGLWLECHTPWLHLIWPLAQIEAAPAGQATGRAPGHATPFGTLTPKVELAFGKVPRKHIRAFAERARTSLPNERGTWMSWEHGPEADRSIPGPRLVWSTTIDAEGTPGGLVYGRPLHEAHYAPCIDLHSHGAAPAFFSPTDDADDAHDVKIAIVIGDLDKPQPSIVARLCCLGVFIPVTVRAEDVFGGAA